MNFNNNNKKNKNFPTNLEKKTSIFYVFAFKKFLSDQENYHVFLYELLEVYSLYSLIF